MDSFIFLQQKRQKRRRQGNLNEWNLKVSDLPAPGIAQRTAFTLPGGETVAHAYGHGEGICGALISDMEYDDDIAKRLLAKICLEFLVKYKSEDIAKATRVGKPDMNRVDLLPFPELKKYLATYQDPANADPMIEIQKLLDETLGLGHKTVKVVLERGEKMDVLVAKSELLSAQSKMFYTRVRHYRLSGRRRACIC
jgi:hypothetical protein